MSALEEIKEMVAGATGKFEFYENDGILVRRHVGEAKMERLVKGRWIQIRAPRSFGGEDSPWEEKSARQLAAIARKYFIRDLGADPIGDGEKKERWVRGRLWRLYDPALKGGSTRRPKWDMFERSRKGFAELIAAADDEVLDELKEQALLGYEHQRERIAAVEQRANFFLGAAGLTTSLVLANAGLLLGSDKLETTWRTLAAATLLVASVCAIAAGLRALQATMITFVRAPPNGVPRVMKRRRMSKTELLQSYIGALMVGQHRLSVIADWKIGRMKEARRWFVIVTIAVMVLTGFVLGDVFSG